MRSRTAFTLLTGLLLASNASCGASPPSDAAQAGGEQEIITGFAQFEWGSSLDEIITTRGRPVSSEGMGGGVTAYTYSDTVLDREASALFEVHAEHGLVGGSYAVRVPEGTSCEILYQQFLRVVQDQYATLTPSELPSRSSDPDFCRGARSGQGGRVTRWSDPTSGSIILLVLAPPGENVVLLYQSARALALRKEQREQQF